MTAPEEQPVAPVEETAAKRKLEESAASEAEPTTQEKTEEPAAKKPKTEEDIAKKEPETPAAPVKRSKGKGRSKIAQRYASEPEDEEDDEDDEEEDDDDDADAAAEKKGEGPGQVTQRFLGAVTHKGSLVQFHTVDKLCKRVYELADSYGLAHVMLTQLLAGAVAAGHDVVACLSPMAPSRLEHLLIPELSLAFVTSFPALPYDRRPYRRIRLDAMVDGEGLQRNKARLRFSRKVSAALIDEAVDSLGQAKTMHDELEAIYNPYVDFERVGQVAEQIAQQIFLGD